MSISESTRSGRMTGFSEALARFAANPPRLISDEEDAANERRRAEADSRARIARAGIPERYRHAAIATCCPGAWEYAKAVAAGQRPNLIITGPSGCGKTHTACAVLREVLSRRPMTAEFASMTGLLMAVKRAYGSAEREDQVIDHYANVRLLVIDDFGKVRLSQWSLPIIWQVIDRRYGDMRPTVFTSQYDRKGLSRRFAEGGGDAEMSQAIVRRMLDGAALVRAARPDA